jgi:negative regulator of sigma E activity
MESLLVAGRSEDLFPPRVSARVVALRRRRRRQRLRSWATPLAVFTVGAWVALVVAAGVGH